MHCLLKGVSDTLFAGLTREYITEGTWNEKSTLAYNLIVGLFLFLLSSCYVPPADQGMNKDVEKLSCVLVFPVTAAIDSSDKLHKKEAEELQQGAAFLNSVLGNSLGGKESVVLVNDGMLDKYHPAIKGGRFGAIKAVSKDLGCETVLLTTVNRFKQRQGGEMAVDAPASTSFDLKLVDTADGRVIWNSSFSETQEALLENLFSLKKAEKRGLRWITVEELAEAGMKERLENCPYL